MLLRFGSISLITISYICIKVNQSIKRKSKIKSLYRDDFELFI